MILTTINPYIAIDEIIVSESKKFVHFLTHFDEEFNVPDNWESTIYTSPHIFKLLWLKENPINQKFFRILKKNELNTITAHNDFKLKVTMFEISSITGNVAFHFQVPENKVLYFGPFTKSREILLNDCFRKCVLNGIDFLYLDNTRVNSVTETTTCEVGRQLDSILNKHYGHKILLNLPKYGYEDLIITLLIQFRFTIFASGIIFEIFKKFDLPHTFETDIRKAEIVIEEESATAEEIKQRFENEKQVTVRIVSEYHNNNKLRNFSIESIGLYQIYWSPHPSIFQLNGVVSFIKPLVLKEIFTNKPRFPQYLQNLCSVEQITLDDDGLSIASLLDIDTK